MFVVPGLAIMFTVISLAIIVTPSLAAEPEGIAIWVNPRSTNPEYAFWVDNRLSIRRSIDTRWNKWHALKGVTSATRDEIIVLGLTDEKEVKGQIYDGGSWSEVQIPESPLSRKPLYWAADVAYESQSGRAVIISSSEHWFASPMKSQTWDGKTWGQEIPFGVPGKEFPKEIQLVANPKSNEMVAALGKEADYDICSIWKGEERFGPHFRLNNTENPYATNVKVAYEQKRGRALVVYVNSNEKLLYRTMENDKWSKEGYVTPPNSIKSRTTHVTIASDPGSNRIVVGASTENQEIWVAIWDGQGSWESITRVSNGSSANNFYGMAVAFEATSGSALVTYCGQGNLKNYTLYRTWTGSWSEEKFGPNLGSKPKSLKLSASPNSDEIMLSVQDSANVASFCLWDGNAFGLAYRVPIDEGQDGIWYDPYLYLWRNYMPATLASVPSPTRSPTKRPTSSPTSLPTKNPTPLPTLPPTLPPTLKPTLPPTKKPTATPTNPPSPLPTAHPTLSPTLLPTESPTPFPTLPPSLLPTVAPSVKPTATPTSPPSSRPTALPTLSPTPLPTLAPMRPPSLPPTEPPTLEPTRLPTKQPTVTPTAPPTQESGGELGNPSPPLPLTLEATLAPTKLPIDASGYSPPNDDNLRGTGEVCSDDSDCLSETCRFGACMASKHCFPVKHKYGAPFNTNSVNIVFVPSSFQDGQAWRAQVDKTYDFFRKFNMFSEDIEQLNFFLVDSPELSKRICILGCSSIDRLLCCSTSEAHRLTEKCVPVGSNTQTIVIDNEKGYGGAGYPASNVATMTTHTRGVEVAVHELGHSLFELGDEYSYFGGAELVESFPNCDSASTCDKWSDLIGKDDVLPYDSVKCIPGCQNNEYYVGESSYMGVLSNPVGAVNERFTCCTYQALTKSMPSYCDVFNFSPNYLLEYCKKNDYQLYGTSNYDLKPAQYIPGKDTSKKNPKYAHLSDPFLVKIKLKRSGKTVIAGKPVRLPAGLYGKSRIEGDFRRVKDAEKKGVDSLAKVKVSFSTGKEVLLFSWNTTIDVPIPSSDDGTSQDVAPQSISEKTNMIEIVLNARGRRIKKIRAKTMTSIIKNS